MAVFIGKYVNKQLQLLINLVIVLKLEMIYGFCKKENVVKEHSVRVTANSSATWKEYPRHGILYKNHGHAYTYPMFLKCRSGITQTWKRLTSKFMCLHRYKIWSWKSKINNVAYLWNGENQAKVQATCKIIYMYIQDHDWKISTPKI